MRGSRRGDGAPRPVTVRHELSQGRAPHVVALDWPGRAAQGATHCPVSAYAIEHPRARLTSHRGAARAL